MFRNELTRRGFLAGAASSSLAACAAGSLSPSTALGIATGSAAPGSQRLSIEQLQKWESLRYGMFLCFGMSTFVQEECPDGKHPAAAYAPDRLDVDQWVSVARDAGMKYVVLTTKHVSGHCLWPSRHTDYTVAYSTNKTNVVEELCKACAKRGVLPGLYYNACDRHHVFGSQTRFGEGARAGRIPAEEMRAFETLKFGEEVRGGRLPAFTTSHYQTFHTAQMTELLTQFGPIAETWLDQPGELGRGYRTFLYNHVAALQPQAVQLTNCDAGGRYDIAYAWPSDLNSMDRSFPNRGYEKWKDIEGKKYYLPLEVCNPIGKDWFWVAGDKPRSDRALLNEFNVCRTVGANLLLSVPPDKHGLIPDESIAALMRLRKNAGI